MQTRKWPWVAAADLGASCMPISADSPRQMGVEESGDFLECGL